MLRSNSKIRFLKIVFVVYLGVTLFFWYSLETVFNEYSFGQLTGMIMLSLVALQPVLSSRFSFLEKNVGQDKLLQWHNLNAKIVTLLIFIHPLLLFLRYIQQHIQFLDISNYYNFYGYWLGYIMLGSVITILITSLYTTKIKLDYEVWKKIHLLTYIVIIGGFVHSLLIGSHFYLGSLIYYWWGILLIMSLSAIIHRYLILPRKRQRYRVIEVFKESELIHTIKLKPVYGKIFSYLPGQFAFTRFHSNALPVEEHHFTLSSSPKDPFISFTIKSLGDYTHLIPNIKTGDEVLVEGPYGAFSNANANGPFLFIAGGIGITPLRSMILFMKQSNKHDNSILLYSAKNNSEMAFSKELKEIARAGWLETFFFEHRITEEDLKLALKKLGNNTKVILVGPDAMMKSITRALVKLGVKKTHIFTERFTLK